jgi:hypothetical protein
MNADPVVSPGFVSAPLDLQPGLSGFGALLQLARLNHFHGSDFLAAFGLRFQYREDLSQLLAFSPKRKATLAAAIGLPPATLEPWSAQAWQPFAGADPWAYLPWRLRACASCLRAGYHSNLFQMPWVARCPWHREQLIETCRRCERPLLEGFQARKELLQCVCGHDHVDETAVLRGDRRIASERREFVTTYRRWVSAGHATNELICPEEADPQGLAALCALVRPPTSLQPWSVAFASPTRTGVHCVRRERRAMAEPLGQREHATMVACAHGLWPGEPGLANLPEHFCLPLIHATREIAQRAPPGTLTERERGMLALPPSPTAAESSLSRYELMFLPVQRAGDHLLLDLHVLHRTASRTIANLAWQLLLNDPGRAHAASGSHRLLVTAIRFALTRGYADGLTHVLGRHVPAIYDHPRIRSGPRLPWALLEKDGDGARRVSVAWSPRRPWTDPADHPDRSPAK